MAQLFKPSANIYAKASVVLGVAGPLTIGLAIAAISRSPANTKVEVPLNQPVPFSHQHHAWELGIDCRYCHVSVEKSSFAGIPATEICMSCHSQIWTNSPLLEPIRLSYQTGKGVVWNKVNKVPEFVYFNHSIHIARGINCDQCHGPVQDMQITYKGNAFQMQWCLQCHRAPENYLYKDPETPQMSPRQQVFNLYWKLQERGYQGLTSRERKVLQGHEQESNDPEDVEAGQKLVKSLGVKTAQLADCWTCHR
jgi:hypothetical protein